MRVGILPSGAGDADDVGGLLYGFLLSGVFIQARAILSLRRQGKWAELPLLLRCTSANRLHFCWTCCFCVFARDFALHDCVFHGMSVPPSYDCLFVILLPNEGQRHG